MRAIQAKGGLFPGEGRGPDGIVLRRVGPGFRRGTI